MKPDKIGIVTGDGALPELIIKDLKKNKIEYFIIFFDKELKNKFSKEKNIFVKYEHISFLLDYLNEKKIKKLMFAGYFKRPKLDVKKFDKISLDFLGPVIQNLYTGDNNIFNSVINVFEKHGFEIIHPTSYSSSFLQNEKVMTLLKPDKKHFDEVRKALKIFNSTSQLDIGQSLVISQGLCLAIETLPGTDAMLSFIKNYKKNSNLANHKSGILFKALKKNQETRIDMPVIGPKTVQKVKDAFLDGIVIQENSVIILNKDLTVKLANKHQIFIWSLNLEKFQNNHV